MFIEEDGAFCRFLGLSLTAPVPDETVLVRFRKRLLKARLADTLFATELAQIEAAGILVKRGTLIDATIVQSARKPPVKGEGGDADAAYCDTDRRQRLRQTGMLPRICFNPRGADREGTAGAE